MATNAQTAVPGDKPPFPPFQGETYASQLLWFALAFVALYLIISRVAIPRIGGIIDARSARIASDLAEAERLKTQSEAAQAAYEKALADARGRAQTLAGQTRDRLNAEAETARKKLEDQLAERMAGAERTIASTKQSAMSNVKGIATDTAAAIVERLTGSAPAAAQVDAAVADVLKR